MNRVEHHIQKTDGNRLYITEYQSEPLLAKNVLICLHGLGSSGGEFAPLAEQLAHKGCPVFLLDFSGHGRSQGTRGLLTQKIILDDCAAVLELIRQQYGPRPCVAAGHSLGAYAALTAAVVFEQITGCVLIAPQIKSGNSLSFSRRGLLHLIGWLYTLLPCLPSCYVKNPASYETLFSSRHAADSARRANFMAAELNLKICALAKDINNLNLVRQLEKPLLFFAGGQDKQIPVNNVKRLADQASARDKRLIVLEHSGHSPFYEQENDQLTQELMNFLKSL